MTGIFETADHAIFIREIADAVPVYRIPILLPFNPLAYVERSDVGVRERTYQLYERCHTIALYREKVV